MHLFLALTAILLIFTTPIAVLVIVSRRRDPRENCPHETSDACWSGFISDAELAAEREYLVDCERPSPTGKN